MDQQSKSQICLCRRLRWTRLGEARLGCPSLLRMLECAITACAAPGDRLDGNAMRDATTAACEEGLRRTRPKDAIAARIVRSVNRCAVGERQERRLLVHEPLQGERSEGTGGREVTRGWAFVGWLFEARCPGPCSQALVTVWIRREEERQRSKFLEGGSVVWWYSVPRGWCVRGLVAALLLCTPTRVPRLSSGIWSWTGTQGDGRGDRAGRRARTGWKGRRRENSLHGVVGRINGHF
ncbi:hypothetical protein QBC34DRAFT_204838 [Podospora aff. communis PSN243]|uniref:Uncharacterized protein n=1 Tax=Podospora aff. communis PSN243 TaxID=3040156 RepID=A0AAV9GYG1_9PEZI|nr:hypothetical protein QBC34DRAFT_204838 [Podospora aff. communis PSN243]